MSSSGSWSCSGTTISLRESSSAAKSRKCFQFCGVQDWARLSPTFANIFLHPLLEALDDSCRGAFLHQHHVPEVCYADDLLLLATNSRHLSTLLDVVLVSDFARRWRLDFIHPCPEKTKSHCIIFGGELLSQFPTWVLSGQQLQTRQQSEHLGVVLDSRLTATCHVDQRVKKVRDAFFGLTPAGMLSKNLCPADKAYVWRTVVRLRSCSAVTRPLSALLRWSGYRRYKPRA